ncbi:GT99 family glycosyltransferase N-terminal domain-containing protein [Pantoea dispersa]|jgi:hypothetical protein|uniref:GT99 family glycosyltransferase N-terminal domain-containing protein n=3 Tax=Pantoea dispersa TaxID=59814 RepID=UPI003D6D6ED9
MASKKSKYLFFWLPYDVKYSYETFLTAFYLSVKRFPGNDAIHIGHEQLFKDVPSHIPEDWLAGFNSSLPDNEELRNLDKIIWSSEVFAELEDKLQSKNLVWEHILTKEYEPLVDMFDAEVVRIKKENDIKAIILWSNCPSVKKVASAHQIPVIHNELGPLREPTYLPTCYFDFSGVNGNTEAANRFERYEGKGDNFAHFGRLALLSLFLKDVKPIRKFDEFDIGLPLQVEDDSNIIAYSNGFDNSELIDYAKSKSNSVLVRKHPYGRVDYKDIESGAEKLSPQEFIALCKEVLTINSSVGFEALLWGKPGKVLGDSPFSYINYESKNYMSALRFALLNYLTPFDFLFNIEYYDWRITMPDENSIAEKHLFHYLNQKHGWNRENIDFYKIPVELEKILFRNLNLQFVENEKNLTVKVDALKKELTQYKNKEFIKIKKLEAELAKYKDDVNNLHDKVKSLSNELLHHQNTLQNVYASKSWRLTQPLRLLNSIRFKKESSLPLKRRVISLVMSLARKVLSNYQSRKIVIYIAKKTGLYGKLKSIYLINTSPVTQSIVDVSNQSDQSRDTITNTKKIKMLKNLRGND